MKVEIETGVVWTITINRPEVRNCVDGETAAGLARGIESFAQDPDAKVLIVTGAGTEAFCAGADLKDPQSLMAHEFTETAGPMGFARLDPGKPTIAAIEGFCVAGGLELAAWCDFRVASRSAEFGALNRRWGVPFMDGGTVRFPKIMGQGNALYLIETGVRIDADRAREMGFVQEVVPSGEALDRARVLAEAIARYPQLSVRSDRSLTLQSTTDVDSGLVRERQEGVEALVDPEMAMGLARFVGGDRPQTPRG